MPPLPYETRGAYEARMAARRQRRHLRGQQLLRLMMFCTGLMGFAIGWVVWCGG